MTEQEAIVSSLQDRERRINLIRVSLKDQLAALEQYRKSLIHECVTGKRRITEADLAVV